MAFLSNQPFIHSLSDDEAVPTDWVSIPRGRHFHYMPELGAALCWGLPALFQGAMPYATCRRRRAWGFRCVLTRLLDARYFYFLFLLPLLVDRASRDDQRCSLKYGKAWDEYRRIVPYKIVPGVY